MCVCVCLKCVSLAKRQVRRRRKEELLFEVSSSTLLHNSAQFSNYLLTDWLTTTTGVCLDYSTVMARRQTHRTGTWLVCVLCDGRAVKSRP